LISRPATQLLSANLHYRDKTLKIGLLWAKLLFDYQTPLNILGN
jgi:hypothetical protein